MGCEPTGHRWKPLLDRAQARGIELVCVNPMLVHRGREEEDFTRDRSDFKDSTIIARRVADRRCYVPYVLEGHWCRLRHLGARRNDQLVAAGWRARGCGTCSNASGRRPEGRGGPARRDHLPGGDVGVPHPGAIVAMDWDLR